MISNSQIRREVTERIRPYRLKIFGYTFIYGLLAGLISGAIGGACGMLFGILGAMIALPICAIFNLEGADVSTITQLFSNSLSSVVSIALSIFMFVLAVGYMKEILLCVEENSKTGPVDFFNLGLKDWKRSIRVYLGILLKSLPGIILGFIGVFITTIAGVALGSSIAGIATIILGVVITIIGFVWSFTVMLLYQTAPYELIHDDNGLDAKGILEKSRETIRGHLWQWTRMNFYYAFIAFVIIFFAIILFAVLMGASGYLASNAGNAAAVFGVLVFVFVLLAFVAICIAASFLMQYFTAKNVINLDELYKAITTGDSNNSTEYDPVPVH